MLDLMRKASKTWVVKILMALLTMGFVFWGIGDFINGHVFSGGPAITVGGTAISADAVHAEFKREMDRLQPMFGGKLTEATARKLGLMNRAIDSLVVRALIDEAGRQLGLVITTKTAVDAIAADPSLRNAQGQFDKGRLDAALDRMGLTEDAFIAEQKHSMLRDQMAAALGGGMVIPADLTDALVRHDQERRVAETILVKNSAVPTPAAPGEKTLAAYYKAHLSHYMAPEYRSIQALLLQPKNVENKVKVTDAMIKEAFLERQGEFDKPERRQVRQILLPSAKEAAKATALVGRHKTLSQIATALGVQVLDLGTVTQAELAPALGKAVFSQARNVVGKPVKTSLGWHVTEVTDIIPAKTVTLAQVRDKVIADVKRNKAGPLLNTLSDNVQDMLGGGATLAQTAKHFHLTLLAIPAVNAQGFDPQGKKVANLPDRAGAFLRTAFQAPQGQQSDLTDNGNDGSFILEVDKIIPPAPKPLATVKAAVIAGWTAEQRQREAHERATAIAAKLKADKNQPAASIAREMGGVARVSPAFSRQGVGDASLPNSLIAAMFADQVGGVAVAPVANGWMVARLKQVIAFHPKAHPEAVKAENARLAETLDGDLSDQLVAGLRHQFGVTINASQLDGNAAP